MKVTEAAFDDAQLRAVHQRPELRRLPSLRAPIVPAAAPPVVSLALIVGGAGAVMAPGGLPFPGDVFALGAVALGGWLVGRGAGGGSDASNLAERTLRATFAERGEVIRAALALASISGRADGPERARRAGLVAAAVEPLEAGDDDGAAGRADLRPIPGPWARGTETLSIDVDADQL